MTKSVGIVTTVGRLLAIFIGAAGPDIGRPALVARAAIIGQLGQLLDSMSPGQEIHIEVGAVMDMMPRRGTRGKRRI